MSAELVQRQESAVIVQAGESATILQVIQRAAADPQCDIEKMERLMAMHERMQARSAEAEFNASMAAMQCEIPSIAERGKNTHTNNCYATLEDIVDVVKPIMREHGFALTFKVDHTGAGMAVTGILMHRAGHREQTTMLLPIDDGKGRSAVQAAGSSVTYGKRYVMCALLNITTRGEDDDGLAAVPTACITPVQAAAINALLARCTEKTFDWFIGEYGSTDCVPKSQHDRLVGQLNKAIRAAGDAQ